MEVSKLKCCRCGWKWTPRKADVRQCPSCKSAYWDQPRGNSMVEKTKIIKKKES